MSAQSATSDEVPGEVIAEFESALEEEATAWVKASLEAYQEIESKDADKASNQPKTL